jgi:hypothetical protein
MSAVLPSTGNKMKLLIFVHGMGVNDAQWSQGVVDKLDELSTKYARFQAAPFSRQPDLEIREITYDQCFRKLVDQWQGAAESLNSWASQQNLALPKVVQWLKTPLPADDEKAKSFFWSTAIDPLLYRGATLVRDEVRSTVAAELVEHISDAADKAIGGVDVTIVAHSLGTAVMHDVLHLLGNGKVPAGVASIEVVRPDRFQFSNLFMIADVSCLGPRFVRDIDALDSIVRPTSPDGMTQGYCQKFFEVWHRFDPFVFCGQFRPTEWDSQVYRQIGPLNHFRSANVHGYLHYLDNPAVHTALFNAVLGFQAVPFGEAQAAIANYGDVLSPACSQQIQRVKDAIKSFEGANDDLELLAIRAAEFYAIARKAADECAGLREVLDVP